MFELLDEYFEMVMNLSIWKREEKEQNKCTSLLEKNAEILEKFYKKIEDEKESEEDGKQ